MPTQADTFAALLVRTRTAAALTQQQLAGRAGISVRAIRDLERGRVRAPRLSSVALLADALEIRGAQRIAFAQSARRDLFAA